MSTKIYDGCRAPRSLDVFDLAARVRAAILPERLRLEAKSISSVVAALIDERMAKGVTGDADFCPFMEACEQWDQAQKKLGERSRLNDPFRFSMQVIAHGDHLYLLPYFDQQVYLDLLTGVEGVEHYPYWDNTDRPDELTDQEWEARGEEWMSVPGVGYGDAPIEYGVAVELGVPNDPLDNFISDLDPVLREQPSLEDRKKALVKKHVESLVPIPEERLQWFGRKHRVVQITRTLMSDHPDVVTGLAPLTKQQIVGSELPDPVTVDTALIEEVVRIAQEKGMDSE